MPKNLFLAHLWQLTLAYLWQVAGQRRGMEMLWTSGFRYASDVPWTFAGDRQNLPLFCAHPSRQLLIVVHQI